MDQQLNSIEPKYINLKTFIFLFDLPFINRVRSPSKLQSKKGTLNMGFGSFMKKVIKMNDLFYASEMLRYDKQLEYRSLTGGILSLGIIIAVMIGFASMIIDTLSLNTINFTETISRSANRQESQLALNEGSNFMLAVQLWGVNISAPVQYFSVVMIALNTTLGQSSYTYNLINFERCTREHWSDFPQIAAQYQILSMSNWLCPPRNTNLILKGDYTSNIYQYVNISVNQCQSWLDPSKPCANSSEVQQIFRQHNDAIRFKVYYTSPLINPGQKDFKSYYLETQNFIAFGPTIGGQAYLYASDYSVSTDKSIWPYPSMEVDQGLLIQDKFNVHSYSTLYAPYAAFYLVKSPTTYSYQRSVQKISNVFSFIGGLISAVSAALFIIKTYNNFAYQVSLALCIFKPPDEEKVNSQNLTMSFFTFIKVSFYNFLKLIGKVPDWPDTSFMIEGQKEIVNQLDIKALVKRVIFMQYCMTNLFEDYQLLGLQIQKPKTPNQIRKIREICQSIDLQGFSEINSEQNNSEDNSNFNNQGLRQTVKIEDLYTPDSFIISGESFDQNAKRRQITNKIKNINLEIKGIIIKQENILQLKKNNSEIKKQQRQSLIERSLSFLKKNAEEGNSLSKKIWNQIEQNPNKLSKFRHRDGLML